MLFKSHASKYYPSYLLFLIVFLFLFFKKLLVWGEDGSSLWMPLMSEYLKGPGHYPESNVIFLGQNLRAIYGELPFWKIFRLFSFDPIRSLNLTYFVFISFLYVIMMNLFQTIMKRLEKIDQVFIFIFTLLSPIVINRVYAGHFNLLFAILPFFSLLLLSLRQNFFSFATAVLSCTFAISIQGYQVLAYYFFYFPCFVAFLYEQKENRLKKIMILIAVVLLSSIIFSFVPFWDMVKHVTGGGSIRALDANIVYSYITSSFPDLFGLLFSEPNPIIFKRDPGFFHEVNYPLSLSIVVFFLKDFNYKKTSWTLLVTLVFLFLFSANVFPFNLISHFPIIKAFRTPQRSLMIPVYFLTFLFFVQFSKFFNRTLLFLFVFILCLISFLPSVELFLFPLVFILLLFITKFKSEIYRSLIVACSFTLFFLGLPGKLNVITTTSQNFLDAVSVLNKINTKFNLADQHKIIHIEATNFNPFNLVLAANYVGIRTAEGYGHPSPLVFKTFNRVSGINLAPTANSIFFNKDTPNYSSLISEFGITDIISINQLGQVSHQAIPVSSSRH